MDRPTPRADEFVPPRRKPRHWQPDPRNRDALDRHIRLAYGEDVAAEYGIPRRRL